MLVILQRGVLDVAHVRVLGAEVRFYDATARGLAAPKVKAWPSAERALAEAEKMVARRAKAGWTVLDRIESPWVAWLGELEALGTRVARTAEDVGVSVEHRLTMRSRDVLDVAPALAGYRDLARAVSFVRHHYHLWRGGLALRVSFELTAPADGIRWAHRQWVPDQVLEEGALGADGIFEIRGAQPGDEILRYESAEAFRERFPHHLGALGDAAIQSLF